MSGKLISEKTKDHKSVKIMLGTSHERKTTNVLLKLQSLPKIQDFAPNFLVSKISVKGQIRHQEIRRKIFYFRR